MRTSDPTAGPPANHSPVARRGPAILTTLLLAATLLIGDLLAPLAGTGMTLPGARVVLAAPRPAATACVNGWREMAIPDGVFISTPFEVITREDKPAWILGGANSGVLALRWNGSSWKRSAGTTSGHRGLVGGALLRDGGVLGVGYSRPLVGEGEGALEPISGRISGSSWRSRAVPDPPGERASLVDVVALSRGRAWAVGTRLQAGRLHAYATRWTGRRWVREDPATGATGGLTAIERTPSGAVWAVGWKAGGSGLSRPYIVRRARERWQTVPAPQLPGGTAVLTDVTFRNSRQGWAVGYLAARGADRHEAILIHWNGKRWARQDLPWANDAASVPRAVSVGDRGDLWVAGTQPANDQREARGFIAHLEGGSWDVDVLDVPGTVRSEVMDIAVTRWGALAVGSVAASLIVLASCDSAIASPAARATSPAARQGSSRIAVSDLRARRRTANGPWAEDADDGVTASIAAGTISVAGGRIPTLPPPVAPRGFRVRDVAAATGLAQTTTTYGGFATDLDGNGYRDVFYSRHGGLRPRLAMNEGGSFSNASTEAFSSLDRHGCDTADVDRDGNKDILCAVGAQRGKAIRRNELSLAPDKPSRQLVTGSLGISDPLGRGRLVAFMRLDDDAWPEVFIGNAPDRDDGLPSANRFYRNEGGRFVPAPGVGLDRAHGATCAEVSDVDGDGDDDLLYCTSYPFGGRKAGVRLMRNQGGRLVDRTSALHIKPMGEIDALMADVTGDGRRDLVQLHPQLLRVSKATARGYRRIFEARTSAADAVGAGDVDGDGVADLYIVRGDDARNRRDLLLVSREHGRSFVSVRIPQTTKGSADDVIALDHDRNGLTDFVVLNGRQKAGPVQLLAAFPE